MVDVFGDNNSFPTEQGPRGPRGPRGASGTSGIDDLCKWMPNTMLKYLHEIEEQAYFVITDPLKDVRKKDKTKEIVEWISRSHNKINLVGETPTKDIIKLHHNNGYALVFHKNHYTGEGLSFMNGVCGFLCVTFCTESVDEDQSLISTYDPDYPEVLYNEISVSASTISINGFNKDRHPVCVSIQHDCQQWTTLYIDWFEENENTISGSFFVNNNVASSEKFNFQKEDTRANFIDVGCRGEVSNRPFTGRVSALELYCTFKQQQQQQRGKSTLPTALKDLIINNQLIKNNIHSPPAKKKKKYMTLL